jgi:hypothetical protein
LSSGGRHFALFCHCLTDIFVWLTNWFLSPVAVSILVFLSLRNMNILYQLALGKVPWYDKRTGFFLQAYCSFTHTYHRQCSHLCEGWGCWVKVEPWWELSDPHW